MLIMNAEHPGLLLCTLWQQLGIVRPQWRLHGR